eukprot:5125315-Alexandrium_andersonii.AAC.1
MLSDSLLTQLQGVLYAASEPERGALGRARANVRACLRGLSKVIDESRKGRSAGDGALKGEGKGEDKRNEQGEDPR